jgi:hypothetical protein
MIRVPLTLGNMTDDNQSIDDWLDDVSPDAGSAVVAD